MQNFVIFLSVPDHHGWIKVERKRSMKLYYFILLIRILLFNIQGYIGNSTQCLSNVHFIPKVYRAVELCASQEIQIDPRETKETSVIEQYTRIFCFYDCFSFVF